MITVIFDKDQNGDITALFMSGHAGYDEAGYDIICSAASTLFYTAIDALNEVCGLSDTSVINEDDGSGDVSGRVVIPKDTDSETFKKAQIVMQTIKAGFTSLAFSANQGDEQYIELIESK